MGVFSLATGLKGASGFGSKSTAEDVTSGVDASGTTAIVTGGASGIGRETARVLAKRGARVVIAARNLAAAAEVRDAIQSETNGGKVEVLQLDLNSFASIRKFASDFLALDLPLHILINNAGVMLCPYQLSEDGLESHFATNHVGHFLLTNLLLEKMKTTARESGREGRIVILSSVAHFYPYKGGIRFDALNDKAGYSATGAYGQSKLANVLHAKELSMRLQEEGANVTVNTVHPGFIMTNLMRYSKSLILFLKFFSFFLWKNVAQGAATSCYVALHPDLEGVSGEYFTDCNRTKPSALALDSNLAEKLWELSDKLTSFS